MLDGEAAGRGIDLLDLPIDRFLNRVYHFATKGGDPTSIQRFDNRLWMPPPGVVATRGPWSVEAETSAFKAFKAALGMRDPAAPPAEP